MRVDKFKENMNRHKTMILLKLNHCNVEQTKKMNKKKSFFYFPTWTLILICILFLGATIFDIYLVLNLDSFETITVNGVEYAKGTQEYLAGLKTMKQSFGGSAVLTFLLSLAAGWFGYKRIKRK